MSSNSLSYKEVEDNKKTNNKRKAGIALLLLLALIGFLNKDSIASLFNQNDGGVRLAKVTSVKNEVRRKKTSSLNWNTAAINDTIHRGDSVSTGQRSTANVKFDNGQSLTLDQNTLIVFDQQADTPEFVSGNIKLTVNGSMKIKIDNEIVTIDGQNADIQVFKDTKKNKQKIVLLSGQSKVTSAKNTIRLQKNKVTEAKEVILKPEEFKAIVAREQKIEQAVIEKAKPVILPPPAPPQVYYYKLYDFYKHLDQKPSEFTLNNKFQQRSNAKFETFSPATFSYQKQIELNTDQAKTDGDFVISDSAKVLGYVVEVSQSKAFPVETTEYFWARSKFKYSFVNPGSYFFRYRKVLPEQRLSAYSPEEPLTILPKKIVLKMAKVKKIYKRAPVVEKPVALAAPAIEKKSLIQFVPPARKPAAITPTESIIKLAPEIVLRNQRYSDSYVDMHASQGFLASNRQFENSHAYSQSYNLGFDIVHWSYNQGIGAEISKSVTSSEAANSVMLAQINYLYRIFITSHLVNGDRIQLAIIAGLENYQNSSSTASDYLSSYSLFKIGLGASIPLFSFWNFELSTAYGMGSGGGSSLQFLTQASYYFRKNLSLGIGFKARKYEFVLSNNKNLESLSETFTSLRYHY